MDSGYHMEVQHEDLPTEGVTGTNHSGTGNWFEDLDGHGTHVAGKYYNIYNFLSD